MKINVREIEIRDFELILDYWYGSSEEYLLGMGADKSKLPAREDFLKMLHHQLNLPINKRQSYCLIWELDGEAIGHSNTNPTTFGKEAYMHLHIWDATHRKKGLGSSFLELTASTFFKNLKLKELYIQPMASNPAPNKVAEKMGFELIKTYTTTPGSINFEQEVNLWRKVKA